MFVSLLFTIMRYSLPLLVSNDNVLKSTGNNLVSYIYSLGNSLRPAETVTKGNDVIVHIV